MIVINKDISKNYYDQKQGKNAITILEQNFHLKAPGFLNTRIPWQVVIQWPIFKKRHLKKLMKVSFCTSIYYGFLKLVPLEKLDYKHIHSEY